MDNRTNTIAGWALAGGIAALGLSIVSGMMFHGERPEKMGYPIEGVEEEGAGGAAAAVPIATLLADRRCGQGRRSVQEVRRLPHDQPGRRQRHRPEPVWHVGEADRPGQGRLRLLRRAEGQSAATGTSTR